MLSENWCYRLRGVASMRILFDARLVLNEATGIGSYVRDLLKHIAAIDRQITRISVGKFSKQVLSIFDQTLLNEENSINQA